MSIHAEQQFLRLKERAPHARAPLRGCFHRWLLSYTIRFIHHLVRYVRSPLDRSTVTKFEFARLTAYDVHAPTAQTFLAWRRSALVVATFPILISCALDIDHAVRHFVQIDRTPALLRSLISGVALAGGRLGGELAMIESDVLEPLIVVFKVFLVISGVLALFSAVTAVTAVVHWRDHRISRRRMLLAWSTTLVSPLLLCVVPVRLVVRTLGGMSDSVWIGATEVSAAAIQAASARVELELGLVFAVVALLAMAPLVLALFPAIIRAGFYAKKLVPQSPIPGWAVAVVPPIYVISASAFFGAVNQVAGSPLLLLGISALLIGPLIYSLTSRWITRPSEHLRAHARVRWVRWFASFSGLFGAACMVIYVVEVPELYDVFQHRVHFFEFGLDVLRNYLTSTIVATDLLIWLLLALRIQETSIIGGDPHLRAALDERLDGLVELEQPHRDLDL